MSFKAALLATAAFCALAAVPAKADTVVTKTMTEQGSQPGKKITLSNFDLDKNGILSTTEVGEMLFKLFDRDTSGVIDASEYDFKAILTVVPMEATTTVSYDYNNDGIADSTQYTYDVFMQNTQLARFDKNKDGLTAHEFVEKPMTEADTDGSGSIDLAEWRNAYMTRITPVPVR